MILATNSSGLKTRNAVPSCAHETTWVWLYFSTSSNMEWSFHGKSTRKGTECHGGISNWLYRFVAASSYARTVSPSIQLFVLGYRIQILGRYWLLLLGILRLRWFLCGMFHLLFARWRLRRPVTFLFLLYWTLLMCCWMAHCRLHFGYRCSRFLLFVLWLQLPISRSNSFPTNRMVPRALWLLVGTDRAVPYPLLVMLGRTLCVLLLLE